MSVVDEIMIDEMMQALIASGCDLDNDRAVIRALNAAGHSHGEVLALADEAARRAKNFKHGDYR